MTPMMTTTIRRLMWAMMVTYVITYDEPNDDNDDLTADAGDDVDLCFFWKRLQHDVHTLSHRENRGR